MGEAVLDHAAWIALGCAVLAVGIVAHTARLAWRQWRRVTVVQRAASALVAVHAERVDEAIVLAGRHAGRLADRGEGFADLLAQLKADVEQLRWLLARIPDERDQLRHAIGDVLLPTERPRPERTRVATERGSDGS